jgi:hypothetical protein
MSNDWSDGPGSNDNSGSPQSPWESPNTTDPGEQGAGWKNEPAGGFTPMGKPGVGDVFTNFQTVLSRSVDSGVAWVYAALMAFQFIFTIVGVVGLVMMTVGFAGLSNFDPNPAAFSGGIFIGVVIFGLVIAIPQFIMLGLVNPFRVALFEGRQAHQGFQWALTKATENILDIFLLSMLYGLLFLPGIGLALLVSEWMMMLWAPVVLLVGFLLSPAVWYAATGHGVFGSITQAFSTVVNNFVLFFLLALIAFGAMLAIGCAQMVLGFILAFLPVVGQLISIGISLLLGYFSWVFYVTVLATVDSHDLGRPLV